MGERTFNTWRDPYGEGFNVCRLKQITIKSGITILVGCNGAGKSTLLSNIKEELEKLKIPVYYFDNRMSGGRNSTARALYENNFEFAVNTLYSSEGEVIRMNIENIVGDLRDFIQTGEVKPVPGRRKVKIDTTSKERWILLDGIDSGFSIDNIVDLKDFLDFLYYHEAIDNGYDLYILIPANAYELVNGKKCFDVMNGKYITFENYDKYRKFILNSKKKVIKRYDKISTKSEEATKE